MRFATCALRVRVCLFVSPLTFLLDRLHRLTLGVGWGNAHMSLTGDQLLNHASLCIPSVEWLAVHAPKLDSTVTAVKVCEAFLLPQQVMNTVLDKPPPQSIWKRFMSWCQSTLGMRRGEGTSAKGASTGAADRAGGGGGSGGGVNAGAPPAGGVASRGAPKQPCRPDAVLERSGRGRRQRAMSAEAVVAAPPLGRVVLFPGDRSGLTADQYGSWKWVAMCYCAELFGAIGVLKPDVHDSDGAPTRESSMSLASWESGAVPASQSAECVADGGSPGPELERPPAAAEPPKAVAVVADTDSASTAVHAT